MKSWIKFLALAAAPMLLSSCICFENPLGERNLTDSRLAGVWHGDIQGNDEYLHIFNLVDGKSLKLIRVTHINHGGIENHEELEMFPTASAKARYMNIKFNCPDAKGNGAKDGWIFARYEITGDEVLKVSLIDYESIKAAIDKDHLHGKAWETTWGANAQVTDSPEELLKFVDSEHANFKPYGDFRHVVDAPAAGDVKK